MDRTFVVVLRARSAARFLESERLELRQLPGSTGPVDVIFQTRYTAEGYESMVPRELWIEVRGAGHSLNEATSALASMAASLLPILALVANAAIKDPVVHLAYEDTCGVSEREFFQAFVPDEQGLPFIGRRVDSSAVTALLRAIRPHPDGERIHRAIGQYQLALLH